MSTNTTLVAAEPAAALIPTYCTRLAPPFETEWSLFPGPLPIGFTGNSQLDPTRGWGELVLDAKPHPPDSPLVIGWYWRGWRRRVSVLWPTAFVASVFCDDVKVSGGGTWVPRCFLTLKPVGGNSTIESSGVLAKGHSTLVTVVAPPSSTPWAPIAYELSVAFNVRSSYSASANPKGKVQATLKSLESCFLFPTAAEGAPELAATARSFHPESIDGALDRQELAAALAEQG